LPIQAELRKIRVISEYDEQKAAQWLLSELRRQVATVEGYDMGQLFDSCLTGTGLLLLLDGLDEVAGDDFPTVSAALQGLSKLLAAKSEHNAIVLTMRIQYYQQVQAQLIDAYPQIAYLRPFKPNEIYTFLTRWPFSREPERNITRIFADLTDRPTLRAMCSNPLVLAMYVANDQTLAPGEIPESRTEFYRSVVDELLVLRRRRQDLVRGPSRALREQREEILGELAYKNLVDVAQPANSLAWADALRVAMRVWKLNEAEAELRFRVLENETGIIAEERLGESFQFIHLTFCEFLAALECTSSQKRWNDLLEVHRKFALSPENNVASRLIEVIPFALALMQRTERPRALNEIAKLGDREVLGRCFLETQLYDSEEWSNYVFAETKYLTSAGETRRDERWLRRLHLLSVVLRDARSWMDHVAGRHVGPELDGLLPSIVGSNPEALGEIFSLYASQDAHAAFRLAESVGVDMLDDYREILINSCQEPPFLALAMERAWKGSTDHNMWPVILAEAAVRYQNVAHKLEGSQIAGDAPSTEMPVRDHVFVRRTKERSYYRACLAFAVSSPLVALHPEFQALTILSNLPPRSRFQRLMSSSFGPFVFLATGFFVAIAGLPVANAFGSVPVLSIVVGVTTLLTFTVLYVVFFADILFRDYYKELADALINTKKDESKKGVRHRNAVSRALAKFLLVGGPGRWVGNFVAGPEQFALYQIAMIRGGVEISSVQRSGLARTDGDLLPPRKLRTWNSGSEATS